MRRDVKNEIEGRAEMCIGETCGVISQAILHAVRALQDPIPGFSVEQSIQTRVD